MRDAPGQLIVIHYRAGEEGNIINILGKTNVFMVLEIEVVLWISHQVIILIFETRRWERPYLDVYVSHSDLPFTGSPAPKQTLY